MKKILILSLTLLLLLSLTACAPAVPSEPAPIEPIEQTPTEPPTATPEPTPAPKEQPTPERPMRLVLSTTTSVNDSGLLEYLRKDLESDINVSLEIISQGSGQAIKTGESGDCDVILVHSKAAEEKFVEEGFGVKRIPFMYNYFVIVGPKEDPAKIKGANLTASEAFKKISKTKKAKFISRGDESGTHTKELNLWKLAEIEPAGDDYISAGKGMGDTLVMANELFGYTLTDKATFLSMEDKLDGLEIVLEESPDLKNEYSVVVVNPDKVNVANNKGANDFKDWITSKKALDMIAEYGLDKYGEALFFVY